MLLPYESTGLPVAEAELACPSTGWTQRRHWLALGCGWPPLADITGAAHLVVRVQGCALHAGRRP
ncbi:hypothetical protein FXN61_28835 [Lentzea sp. PSKA42]|uniref:Uncharacterized protein n=1 Tax=Lentzea indica TaxID=2604800 RepID=A0ABX1FPU1_9PSEU|nr:hypothetical protein [Lentzea indica]NKE60577.1 hypothetical protein [Lentzea indica]